MPTRHSPVCKICDQGKLIRRKRYRLSTPVVIIGYIFLVPAVIGMTAGVFLLLLSAGSGIVLSDETQKEVRTSLAEAQVPETLADQVLSFRTIAKSDLASLNQDQRDAIEKAETLLAVGTATSGATTVIGAGFSIFLIISSFCGGLLGWLLVMKKKVLQCSRCGAIVNAS